MTTNNKPGENLENRAEVRRKLNTAVRKTFGKFVRADWDMLYAGGLMDRFSLQKEACIIAKVYLRFPAFGQTIGYATPDGSHILLRRRYLDHADRLSEECKKLFSEPPIVTVAEHRGFFNHGGSKGRLSDYFD